MYRFKSVFFLMLISINCCAQNITKRSTISFSSVPNYHYSVKKRAAEILKDGNSQTEISPTFWTNGKSVGWKSKDQIEINFEFPEAVKVSMVSLNTANGENAGVFYPQNIFLFSSSDKIAYKYLGDLIISNDENNLAIKSVAKFALSDINIKDKFFKLVVIPRGNYFFVDEIEFFSDLSSKQNEYKSIESKNIIGFLEDLLHEQKDKNDSEKKENFSKYLNQQVKKELLVEYLDVDIQLKNDIPIKGKHSSSLAVKQYGFKNKQLLSVFRIINNSHKNKTISFFNKNKNKLDFDVFRLKSIENSFSTDIHDVLIPFDAFPYTLIPGETFYLVLKINYNKAGFFKHNFVITDSSVSDFSIDLKHYILEDSYNMISGNSWVYFDYDHIKHKKEQVLKDVGSHGINTFPIPRNILSKININNEEFRNYLKGVPTESNILLFFNFVAEGAKEVGGNKEKFLTKKWKENFERYLNNIYKELNSLGYFKIYVYPYDEIKVDNMNEFKELMLWIKNDLEYKTFVTILSSSSLEAANYVDIVQLNRKILKHKAIQDINIEKWVYDVMYYSRDLSPEIYRKFGWEAYYYDMEGIGFWNYSQSVLSDNSFLSKRLNGRSDFSAIYNDERGNILSSLRWEAFSLAFDDYRKLKILEKRKGKDWAKVFVKSALFNKDKEDSLSESIKKLNFHIEEALKK